MNYYWGKGRLECGFWSGRPEDLRLWTHDGASEWFPVDEVARAKAIARRSKSKRVKNENQDDKVSQGKAGGYDEYKLGER